MLGASTVSLNQERDLLKTALASSENAGEDPHNVISELYEARTGQSLVRETDPLNGEDYYFKGAGEFCISINLHKKVVDFYQLHDRWPDWGNHSDNCELFSQRLMEKPKEFFV